ncbi:Phosphate transporter PHO1 homolog 3 [Striga hermonthica]|uniref:Phosphate transporter PHO1 homolog 3 n=1 Tax=Striga hermonthica TaxID=68872 RepID=A0A9N7N8J6_STRHE|nr:Phosphate transporter PHO1 homolog 3 [Striga hermonthica]
MVQEWQGAYMDYNHLKKLLKHIIVKSPQLDPGPHRASAIIKKRTLHRGSSTGRPDNVTNEITESPIQLQPGSENCFQTMFVREGQELEILFFKTVDVEFNKVAKFYEAKVKEVKLRAHKLSVQMDALIALRLKVDNKPSWVTGQNQGGLHNDMIHEVDQPNNEVHSEDETILSEKDNISDIRDSEILEHVKINVDPGTPVSTLRNLIKSTKSKPSLSKYELQKAEKTLQRAFVEFYQQLRLLKSYHFLNMLAFSKIMKKYDKITSRNTSTSFIEIVGKSYLGSCNEVNMLVERLEKAFIKHFTDGDRRKGMNYLRPTTKKEKHSVSFFLGLFTGCCAALIGGINVSIHARDLLDHEGQEQYMSNIFPLYSLFVYIVLHMLMYGANTYLWRRYHVNYPFIFGFKPGTELGFREVFLLASGLSALGLAGVLANLDMEMDPETEKFQMLTELVPLGLVTVVLLITFFPLNIIYRSSRFFFIRCAWRCIWAPLYTVRKIIQKYYNVLNWQIQAIRSLQFYVCYYGWGDFRRRSNKCLESDVYKIFYIAVAIIPFSSRLLQASLAYIFCLRVLFEDKNPKQFFNGLKYFSTVVALVMRTMYSLRRQTYWRVLAASTSGVTTVYNTYWDIVIDWGLLRRNAKNRWLRDNLLISCKPVYFVAIVVNVLLRLVWMQLILDFNEAPFLHRNTMILIVSCLEILRRGIWNFFRLENEHFNNIEKFRAFKSVTLPFYYQDGKMM